MVPSERPVKVKTTPHGITMAPVSALRVVEGFNTRRNTEPDGLESVEHVGITNPLHVRWADRSKTAMEVIDGERRYNAALKYGVRAVPVHNWGFINDHKAKSISYTANDGQKPWTKAERMAGVRVLIDEGLGEADVADLIGVSVDYVRAALRIDKKGSKKLKKAIEKPVSEGGVDTRAAARAVKLPPAEQDELVDVIKGKARKEASEKVAEFEEKAGVTSRGPRILVPARREMQDPPKPKCRFELVPNANELCESMEKRIRNRLSHNAADRESSAQLQVLEVLKGKATIADVFGWE